MKTKNKILCCIFLVLFVQIRTYAQRAEVVMQTGHSSNISSIAFSPDGKILVSATFGTTILWDVKTGAKIRELQGGSPVSFSPNGKILAAQASTATIWSVSSTIKLWDVESGKEIRTFEPHTNYLSLVSFSSDGKTLASLGSAVDGKKTIKLWDVKTGKEIGMHEGLPFVESFSFSPDGKILASRGFIGYRGFDQEIGIKLWDVESGKEMKTLEGYGPVSFSPDGKILAILDGKKTIKLWDVKTGKEIRMLEGHSGAVSSVSFSPDGRILASGKWGETILWDVMSGEKIRTLGGGLHVFFSPDGKILASDSRDGLKLWDVESGNELATVPVSLGGRAVSAVGTVFSPNGRILATAEGDDRFSDKPFTKLWDMKSLKEIRALQGHAQIVWIRSVSFSPDGKILATGSDDGIIRLWDIESAKQRVMVKGRSLAVEHLSFSPDGKILASGSKNGIITLWDMKNAKQIVTLEPRLKNVTHLSFSPDGKILSSGRDAGDYGDQTLQLWDVESGEEIRAFEEAYRYYYLSPDWRVLASVGYMMGEPIKLWDVKSGKQIRTLQSNRPTEGMFTWISFSHDSKILISGRSLKQRSLGEWPMEITFWDVESGNEIRTVEGQKVVFSPDGRILVTRDRQGRKFIFKLWDVKSGKEIRTFEEHVDRLPKFSFSQDGKILVTSKDSTILWDVESGNEILRLKEDSLSVISISFSQDGKILVTRGSGGIKLWDVRSGNKISTLGKSDWWYIPLSFLGSDRKILATLPDGKSIKFWDMETGQLSANLIPIDTTDYVVTTPDNYYTASKGATKGVAFRVGTRAFPFEQFDLKFNRPDIVLKRIGYAPQELIDAYHKAYLKRLKKMKFTEDMLAEDFHLPEIEILSQNLPLSTEEKILTFKVKAEDSKYLLDRLNVYVNDVAVFGTDGISLRDKKVSTIEQEIVLELSHGANKIQISALNEKGVESLKETFEVAYQGPTTQPDLYVVAIGVSKYRQSQFNLQYASKDANDIARLFKGKRGLFKDVYTTVFTDENATVENIRKAKEFLMKSKVDDQVILFVAGHGLVSQELDYYLATYNTDFFNPSQNGLPYEDLENLVDGIPARKKLVLIDACNSGEIEKEEVEIAAVPNTNVKARSFRGMRLKKELGMENVNEFLRELFADLRRGTGAVVLSSSSGAEYSYEDEKWRNGVFTYSVIEALQKGKAGRVKVSELINYVADRVKALTNGKQNPTMRRENLEYDFVIY
jgi:WD40 repeat protein